VPKESSDDSITVFPTPSPSCTLPHFTLNAILNVLRLAIRYTLPRDSASISSSGVIVDSDSACTVPCSSSCSSCVADSEKHQVPSSAV